MVDGKKCGPELALAEISQYIGNEPESSRTSPLTFLQSQEDIYAGLAKIVMQWLAIPATS